METHEKQNPKEPQQIFTFDTTLRDGEQAPGFSMTKNEKVEIAQKLAEAGIDVIEAGFPIASQGDFEGVKAVADSIGAVRDVVICALARALKGDIARAADALKNAKHNRIHTFMGTTDKRLETQYNNMSREKAVDKIRDAVHMAKDNAEQVEFSAEDATRTDIGFLYDVYDTAVEEGAKILDIPDTVAFNDFYEYGELIEKMVKRYGPDIVISTHCHNDFGLATANTWAGIRNGAKQAHVTINGIGERAGNASLQEVSNLIAVKGRDKHKMNFDRRQNRRLSETLTRITGIKPQPNNPINGENAFAHESGIHQDGWLKEREIYEVVHPEDNGYDVINALVLGKHSGHAGVKAKTGAMGIVLSGEQICSLTKEIETWADANPRKRGIPTDELQIMIARNPELQGVGPYRLVNYSDDKHNGTHCVAVSITVNGIPVKSENTATGPIEAGIQAIKSASGIEGFHFEKYLVHSQGKDEGANALVSMEIYREDMPEEHVTAYACGADTIEASLRCFINGVNQLKNRQSASAVQAKENE